MSNDGRQEQFRESISALVDGQASEMELRRIMKSVESDDSIRKTWSRYQAVSQTIQGEAPATLTIDLSDAVRAAIDEEPSANKSWIQNVTRVAIAASVAGVVVLTAQFTGQQMDQSTTVVASNASVSAVSPATLSLPAGFQAPSVAARTVSSESTGNALASTRNRSFVNSPQVVIQSANTVPSKYVQRHIQEIMTLHANQSALNSNRGMLPYARVPALPEAVQP